MFFWIFLWAWLARLTNGEICGNYILKQEKFKFNNDSQKNISYIASVFVPAYSCPFKNEYPKNYTNCCENLTLEHCCDFNLEYHDYLTKQSSIWTSPINKNLFYTLITLGTISVLALILLVICCVWSKCPFYKKFQLTKHYNGDVIEYHMDSDKPDKRILIKSVNEKHGASTYDLNYSSINEFHQTDKPV